MNKKIKGKKYVIVIHEGTTGLGQDLRDFIIKNRASEVLFIAHPLLYLPDMYRQSSRYELYRNGHLIKEHKALHYKLPESILYGKDIIYTLLWTITIAKKADVFIGVGNLNAFAGVLLKMMGIINKSIYYVIDYVPNRFKNKSLNMLYHYIEKIAAENSDTTWNLSPRMITGREEKWKQKFKNQLVVPHGVHYARIKRIPFERIHANEIIYMGTLYKKQGVHLVLQALVTVKKKIKNVMFVIIGRGPYEYELKLLVKKLHLEDHVQFLGYIKNHSDMENRIAQAAIAAALYDKDSDLNDFTYYSDPGKIKNYLGSSVPVIMTDVPYVAQEVKNSSSGFIVPLRAEEIATVLIHFLSDKEMIKKYRENAKTIAKKYQWNDIFARAFAASMI